MNQLEKSLIRGMVLLNEICLEADWEGFNIKGFGKCDDTGDIIWDALGIPQDNSVEVPYDNKNYFCRDWFYNLELDFIDKDITEKVFFDSIEQQLRYVKKALKANPRLGKRPRIKYSEVEKNIKDDIDRETQMQKQMKEDMLPEIMH